MKAERLLGQAGPEGPHRLPRELEAVHCTAGGEQGGIHRVGGEDGEAENVQHSKPKIG